MDVQGYWGRIMHPAQVVGPATRVGVGRRIGPIIVAPTDRPFVERFREYLPAVLAAGVGVDLLVYTPEEFEQMRAEERPFLSHALKSARPIHVG